MDGQAHSRLIIWSAVLLGLLFAHDLTHVFDSGLNTKLSQLALVAIPQWAVIAGVMLVVVRGEPRHSALAALLLGFGTAIGFALIHLAPFAPASYQNLSPSTISWALALIPPAVGLYLGVLGWRALRASAPASTAVA